MSTQGGGGSLFYASDKNIFDALNEHKVDQDTIVDLFLSRNMIVSKKTPREDLARHFSRLNHDLHDHQVIAGRLGVAARRERTTFTKVDGALTPADVVDAISSVKSEVDASGDFLQVTRRDESFSVRVQYTRIDYRKNELSQRQVRDGTIDFVRTKDGYVIRNSQNHFVDGVREQIVEAISKHALIERTSVALIDVSSYEARSRFFLDLMRDIPGFSRRDVTDVYVYKPKPASDHDEDDDDNQHDLSQVDIDIHVEKVALKGNGVSQSAILDNLLGAQGYYIVKVSWIAAETMKDGDEFELEAAFANPKDCTGFSYLVKGVFPRINGRVLSKKRTPFPDEVNRASAAIESRSLALANDARPKASDAGGGDDSVV